MDPRILQYYNRELQHIREMGGEFAREFPKIAGRLGLEGFECADPYVERLLEGFAFLAARVQLKIDAEFPRFTQHLLEMTFPNYLCPTPSMAVVRLEPELSEGALAEGVPIPRDTILRSLIGKGEQTSCEYRTGHDVTLWPIEIIEAEYFTRDVATIGIPQIPQVKAGVRLRLQATAGLTFEKLALQSLPIFLHGPESLPMRLYEQFLGNAHSVHVRPAGGDAPWSRVAEKTPIARVGFEDSQALLPFNRRSFEGYRLLHEYFACPARFLFVELMGLAPIVRRCKSKELEIVVLFNVADRSLENVVSEENFQLFCTPAINLFPKRADRIHLSDRFSEHHIVPDRTRPMDFEVHQVTEVTGHGTSVDDEQEFLPFYSWSRDPRRQDLAYYTVHRQPRVMSEKQRRLGSRSSYMGHEAFLSLVDVNEAPYRSNLRQLSVKTLCTNRDLPLHLAVGQANTDFTLEIGAPVNSIRCLAGPTRPIPTRAHGDTSWRAISHLALNYLSLVDNDARHGAAALRELLGLYTEINNAPMQKQIEGLRNVTSRRITRRLPTRGPITFGRGLQIEIDFDEAAFEGSGVFLLGAVLEQFFGRYASINSFTETVVKTEDRGKVMTWPVRTGQRHVL